LKKVIAFVFEDNRISFLKSYSFIKKYKIKNGIIDPMYIKINLTDDIDEAYNWSKVGSINYAYDNLKGLLSLNSNIKSILKIDSSVYKKYVKIKKLKQLCQWHNS